MTTHQSDPANRARLRWRSRRGLLENDLMGLLLGRSEPTGEVDLPQVHAMLARLRRA